MQVIAIKLCAGLALTIIFLVLTFITTDVIDRGLITSLSIIAALLTYRLTPKTKSEHNEH
jgi:hypothetical protein